VFDVNQCGPVRAVNSDPTLESKLQTNAGIMWTICIMNAIVRERSAPKGEVI
jgi:hypothetical protein